MRRGLLIGLLCVAVLAVALVWLLPKTPSYTIAKSYNVPDNFSTVAAYGSNSVVLPNGRSFIDYNYVTGQTKSLGPGSTLTGLSNLDSLSVSPDGQYVLFHEESAVSGGFLYAELAQAGLNPNLDYWWVYSVSKQTFAPLPQGSLIAKFAYGSDKVVALASANGNETLTTYSPDTGTQNSFITITGSSNFFPVSSGYLLQTPDNDVLFTKDGTVSQTSYTAMTIAGVTPDGETAIGVSTGKSRHLVLINLVNNSTKSLASDIIGQPVLGSGMVLYLSGSVSPKNPPELYTYNLSTRKTYSLQFSGAASALQKLSLNPAALIGNTTAILGDNSNNYYLIGNNLAALQLPGQYFSQTVQAPDGSSIPLAYDTQTDQVTATIDGSDPSSDEAAIYQQLKSNGYNPDLIDMEFVINSGTGDE